MIDQAYLEILKDSFWGSLTAGSELAYITTLYFGEHNTIAASISALIGSVGGLTTIYLIFYGFATVLKKILDRNPGYPQARHYISKFAPVFGIFSVIPQVNVIPSFFFGFAKLSLGKFILIIFLYRALYYIFMMNTVAPLYS